MIKTIIFIILNLTSICFANAQSKDSISIALSLIDLSFDSKELDSMKLVIERQKESFKLNRKEELPNDWPYNMVFRPLVTTSKISEEQEAINWGINEKVKLPENKDDLVFYPAYKLDSPIKTQKISSTELTQLFIDRLRKYEDTLKIGILNDEFKPDKFNHENDSITIELLKLKGFNIVQKQLSSDVPVKALSFIISAEASILLFARYLQEITPFDEQHPPYFQKCPFKNKV